MPGVSPPAKICLDWRKNLSPLGIPPIFKQGLVEYVPEGGKVSKKTLSRSGSRVIIQTEATAAKNCFYEVLEAPLYACALKQLSQIMDISPASKDVLTIAEKTHIITTISPRRRRSSTPCAAPQRGTPWLKGSRPARRKDSGGAGAETPTAPSPYQEAKRRRKP